MSVEAAGVYAQIIPVLLLALALDLGFMPNPELRRVPLLVSRLTLTGIYGGLVWAEAWLLMSLAKNEPLSNPLAGWLLPNLVVVAASLIAIPHLTLIWGRLPKDPEGMVREQNRKRDAKQLARVEKQLNELRARLGVDAEG